MKLTIILLTTACLTASAAGHSQKVTLSMKKAPLENVFREIQKQTGYDFLFTKQMLENTRPVDIDVKDASLSDVLQICLKGQPLGFSIENNSIVIQTKLSSAGGGVTPVTEVENNIDISGKVTDADGNPLAGASVHVRGTSLGTTTDANGMFTLKGVDENATLEVSFVGYQSQTISVSPFVKTAGAFTVQLKRNDSPLDEIQIQAYGTTNRRIGTGNITTVKAKDIEKQPVQNPLLALQGRVPGLFITQNNGLPGTGVSVRIQGQNSITKGNDPLYVIDGVPYVSQLLPTSLGDIVLGASGNGGNPGNPLSYINPADIESIDVLEDADATAIYGSRAANGVILITTKKGKAGKTKIDFNIQSGFGKVTRKLDMMNTQQYLEMRREAKKNDNATIGASDYDINGLWDTTRYTNWQKVLIGGTANYTNVNTNVSGGNAGVQYFVGGTYHRETTVFPGDLSDQKGSMHFNLNSSSSNQKFNMQLSGNYSVDNNQLQQTDLTAAAIRYAPDAPALHNPDGSLNWAPRSNGSSSWINPLRYQYNRYKIRTNNLVSNVVLRYQILSGLEIRSSFGYTNLQQNELQTIPAEAQAPENRPNHTRVAVYGDNNINSWIVEPQVNYKRAIGKGKIEALFGMTIQQNNSKGQKLIGVGYNSDQVMEDIKSANSLTVDATTASTYKYNAVFGRINYNWLDKYIINLTGRRDGSSRFGPENQFHNFGSAGVAWIFSEENSVKKNLSFISFGKLRANYGTTGNDQIGDYQFMNLYSPIGVGVMYQNSVGLSVNGLNNPFLQWEETKKLQFGLDIGFLKNQILFTTNYIHNRSSNELLLYNLPITTGFTGIIQNFPATVQNMAWEFSLNTTNIKTKNFSWSSNINLTIPKNKLVSFPDLASSPYSSTFIIGQPVSILQELHLLGVNKTTGKYEFADSHGNATSSPDFAKDRTVIINPDPKFYGGFQNSIAYKGFQFDFLFQFVKQIGTNTSFGIMRTPGTFGYNQPLSVLNRWQKIGDAVSIQRYNSNSSLSQQFGFIGNSDAGFSDASYIRLKNLSLSWQLLERWMQKVRLQNAQIYIQGQNLLTITKYKGLDPENRSITSLPPLRVLTFGIHVGL